MKPKDPVSLPELLSPAGTFEKLPFALRYGADAVYLAGQEFGMRSAAGNFTDEELFSAFHLVHAAGKKCYLTLNTMPRDSELVRLESFLDRISQDPPDGVIVSDLGVFALCRKHLPNVAIHVSTQASAVNSEDCRMWYHLGAKRVVLARELSLSDIDKIRANTPLDLELEVFIHGSMCVAYSGRCLLSNYFTGRDANRGACTQPCRWSYHFTEDSRPDEILTVESHREGSFVFGSKDLCMLDHLRELIDCGINSFKIEGRMKSAYYCAAVTNVYRIMLDALAGNRPKPNQNALWRELMSVSHRAYGTGFFFDETMLDPHLVDDNGYESENSFLAEVLRGAGKCRFLCVQKNRFSPGEEIEVLRPGQTGEKILVSAMYDEDGNPIENCPHPKMKFIVETNAKMESGDLLRRIPKILYNSESIHDTDHRRKL